MSLKYISSFLLNIAFYLKCKPNKIITFCNFEGEGDMAVSNAVGSNVFDILLCLGLPWTIQCFYSYPHPIAVYSEGTIFIFTYMFDVNVVF